MKKVLFLIVTVLFTEQTVLGGWVIREKSHFTDTHEKQERKVYVQDHMIRLEEEGLITIIDLYKEIIQFYNPDTKKYWEGTINDFDRDMVALLRARFLKKISGYSLEERKKAEESYDRIIRQLQLPDSAIARHDRLDVKVSQTKAG